MAEKKQQAGASAAMRMIADDAEKETSYNYTVSPDGKIETMILMHSRMGIRVEFNVHKSILSLWISPQAGKSLDISDRNFSCRDDHTGIFDRISFPELAAKRFVRCDYDPFHSVLQFEGQALHLATLLDKPVVLLWVEKEEVVDFKSDKQDAILSRTNRLFAMRHPDRGKTFDFAAALAKGKARFQHQLEVAQGRSTYARIVLAPKQLLVIVGELRKEKVPAIAVSVAAKPFDALMKANEKLISEALLPGAVILKGHPQMQKLYDMNKRHLLSVQDASGAIRAALKYVYYLIWITDGSVTATSMIQTGWHDFMKRWMEFVLENPASQEHPPKGRFYGQLVDRKITKREEFGSLCAVWAAFMYWGLTGDKRFVSGKALRVLEDAVAWLERYCWDAKIGALGTFYHGGGAEDPFYGSNDFGWDAAVGCPMARNAYAPRHDGRIILRAYEFGMNLNQYNMWLMLAAATSGKKSAGYRRKARLVEKFLVKLLDKDLDAYYLLEGKGLTPVRGQGYSRGGLFAVQSRSPAFFMPQFVKLWMNRMNGFAPETEKSVVGQMACYYYGKLFGLDTEFVDEDGIIQSLEVSLPYHLQPSKFTPMAYTMVETMGAKDGEFHDIRPQAFSAGPFQAAIANLAVRVMPSGVALRASNHISELRHFEYLRGHLDIRYAGRGKINRVIFNGKALEHTLQVPDKLVKPGANKVLVELAPKEASGSVLVYSTVRLSDISTAGSLIRYHVTALCQNVLIFRNIGDSITVRNSSGKEIPFALEHHGPHAFLEFTAQDPCTVDVGL